MSSDATAGLWTCPNCSQQIEPPFDRCWNCGVDQEGKLETDTAEPVDDTPSSNSRLGWSVLASLVFWPLGLLALIFSVLAEVSVIHGNPDMARRYSDRAAACRLGAFVIGCLVFLVTASVLFSPL